MRLSATELFIILLILILLFGGKKIPEFVRGITRALREYRKAAGPKTPKKEEE